VSDARSVLVTGSTDGIGLATARELSARGWHVFTHGRDASKAAAAAQRIGTERSPVTPVWGEFSSMHAVVDTARQVRQYTQTLDALVNNAGIYATQRVVTVDGFESTMAVNHFAPYVLTHHLLPQLRAAQSGRIVNVSSMTHSGAKLDLSDLSYARNWSAYGVYAASKLANILFTRHLSTALARSNLSVNALHPGVIGTKLLRAGFGGGGASVADGARTSVYLVDSADVSAVSGKYFVDCRETSISRGASDPKLAARLWDISAELLAPFL
jgi:NAD(P)-dependent dehydrogenase (short-subunit alcohol dehydrogenase family)